MRKGSDMSSIVDQLQYLVWADSKIADLLTKLEPEELDKSFSKTSGTIKLKLQHLAEEYIAWLYDLKSQSWREEIKKVESMNGPELLQQMSKSIAEWIDFIRAPSKEEFLMDEGDFKVPISLDEVVFNLVNHSSYHRGQIVLFLRTMGYEVSISDYYWFKIDQLNKD